MTQTVVFDLDKVLLGGDATTLFLHGRLRERPATALPLLLAGPLLLPAAAVPGLRPLVTRVLTRLAARGKDHVVAGAMGAGKVRMLVERGYPPPWAAVYSDSASDLPLFAGTPRPVLVNAGERAAAYVGRVLGRRPEVRTWQ